jgi:DNA repair exonuclease SbcCD ATPase subunit
MFNSIHLQNYRKHTDLVVLFTDGLNAVRAGNEAGKSTLLEAMAYAMFGARVLKEPLADVVTYDKKEADLKVTITFTLNAVVYTLKRGKSGAELTFGTERVTGQTEVTKFVESLIGATADVCSKLMLAKQSSVVGALSEGAQGTVKLMETLANFDLITNLIDLVQEKLPTGNTKGLEAQVISLSQESNRVVESDTSGLQKAVEVSQSIVDAAQKDVDALSGSTASLVDLMNDINSTKNNITLIANIQKSIAEAEATLAVAMPEAADEDLITKLQKDVQDQEEAAAAIAISKELSEYYHTLPKWMNGSYAQFKEVLAAAKSKQLKLLTEVQEAKLEKATIFAKVIKETSCALCGKDLKDVPEVVAINAELDSRLVAIQDRLTTLEAELSTVVYEVAALNDLDVANTKRKLQYAKAAKYITVDDLTVPAGYTWIGPTTVDSTDAADKLKAEQAKKVAYNLALGKRNQVSSGLDRLKAQLAAEAIGKDKLEAILLVEQTAYEDAKVAHDRLATLKSALQADKDRLAQDKAALKQEQAVFDEASKQVSRAVAQLAIARQSLVDQNFNNTLVQKLRSARPQIADRLWSMVLTTVSTYFSSIRGEVSVVTKTDEGFRINGRPLAGLSGSTQDALGLAIRVALTKTFLPNASFLILDEVAAGMDDTRESAMLGMIASCGMDQTLLVTHSELADSFAANIITL